MLDLKEKVAELNDFEENMSFENYKDGVIAYSLKKGFEYFDKNKEQKKYSVDFFDLNDMQNAVRYAFNTEFDSFIGNANLKEKVEFVTNRAEEFGLHLDIDGHILEAKTPEMEKEKNDYIKGAKERYECIDNPDMSTEEYLAEKILKKAKDKVEIEVESKFFDIEDIYVHIDRLQKIADDNSDKNLEYFEKKDQIILELLKDEIKDYGIGDFTGHVIAENLSNAGYKNEGALGYSDKAFFLLKTEFPDFKSKETFYRNQLLEKDKKVVSNEQEIER